jgi:hypothetical protein
VRRLRHAVSRPCDAICAVLEPSAVLRLVREHGVRWSGEGKRARSPSEGAPTAHGVTLARLGERLGAHCPRRPHPAASSCMCLRALVCEGVPGAPRARGGATASSPKGNRGMAGRMRASPRAGTKSVRTAEAARAPKRYARGLPGHFAKACRAAAGPPLCGEMQRPGENPRGQRTSRSELGHGAAAAGCDRVLPG